MRLIFDKDIFLIKILTITSFLMYIFYTSCILPIVFEEHVQKYTDLLYTFDVYVLEYLILFIEFFKKFAESK